MIKITNWEEFSNNFEKYLSENNFEINILNNIDITINLFEYNNRNVNNFANFLRSKNISFKSKVILKNYTQFDISKWFFYSGLSIKNLTTDWLSLIFDNNIKWGDIELEQNIKIKNITIINCKYNKAIFLNYLENITIKNCSFKEITFSNKMNNEDNLWSRVMIKYDWSYSTDTWKIKFEKNFKINELNIVWNPNILTKFKSLEFCNIKFESDLWYFLRNFSCDDIKFFQFTNLANIFKLHWIKIANLFSVTDWDFWKANFNNVNIKHVYFRWIVFTDCIMNNIEWWDAKWKDLFNENEKKFVWISDTEMKDIYRQLKFVMDKNWNYTEWNKFYQKEMEYYWKSLKSKSDKFIFWCKKIIWDFWNNWLRPLGLLIVLVFIFTSYEALFFPVLSKNYDCIAKMCINNFNFWKEFLLNFIH